jgi:hypothetical protein
LIQHFSVALATVAASCAVVVLTGPPRRTIWFRRLAASPPEPERIRADDREDDLTRVRFWPHAALSVAWETTRCGRSAWFGLAGIGLGIPLLIAILGRGSETWILMLLNRLVGLIAGVSVLGAEGRGSSRRFLAHHGARPALVWVVKLAVWCAGLAVLWAPFAFLWAIGAFQRAFSQQPESGPIYLAAVVNSIALGVLCGMTIPRAITAVVAALVACFAVMIPQAMLNAYGMMPPELIVAIPLVILGVSFGWAGDWMLSPPGLKRWLRLALLVAGAIGGLFAAYVSLRILSVPDAEEDYAARMASFSKAVTVDTSESNAAAVYRKISRDLRGKVEARVKSGTDVERVLARGWEPSAQTPDDWLRDNTNTLAQIRQAVTLPRCELESTDRLNLYSPVNLPSFELMSQLLWLSFRERRGRGDLAGEWDDLMVQFRMVRHRLDRVPPAEASRGLLQERQALRAAMEWAADKHQTPEQLRAARKEYQSLLPMPPITGTIQFEAILIENTLNLPREELADLYVRAMAEPRLPAELTWQDTLHTWAAMPWEIARARRASRLLVAAKLAEAAVSPASRPVKQAAEGGWVSLHTKRRVIPASVLSGILPSTPLLRLMFPNLDLLIEADDRNEVGRRALVQILALRAWQLSHGGSMPNTLARLVPSELERLPGDPYSKDAFGYIPTNGAGAALLPLGQFEPMRIDEQTTLTRPTVGQWLLYSIGPDRVDDHARVNDSVDTGRGDIIFPLPRGDKYTP